MVALENTKRMQLKSFERSVKNKAKVSSSVTTNHLRIGLFMFVHKLNALNEQNVPRKSNFVSLLFN